MGTNHEEISGRFLKKSQWKYVEDSLRLPERIVGVITVRISGEVIGEIARRTTAEYV